jgi:uncharacterized membrane protein YfcA
MAIVLLAMLCSVFIGTSLGVFGAGGSILTMPVVHYILGVDAVKATATSLVVVCVTASVGAFLSYKKGRVHVKAALALAIPAFAGMAAVRTLVLPKLPGVFSIGNLNVSRDAIILIPYSLIMLSTAAAMIKPTKIKSASPQPPSSNEISNPGTSGSALASALAGCFIGLLSGFVGAGGGFLIVPALNLFAGLSMSHAIGTSLAIIALNSGVGSVTDFLSGQHVDWNVTLILAGGSLLGMALGTRLREHFQPHRLRSAFGIFLAIMAIIIVAREVLAL